MRPTSFMLPNISAVYSDCSIIDLKNQYSIVNRLRSRDVLANFSLDLEIKLPQINRRIKAIEDKQNQLNYRENKILAQNKYMQHLQSHHCGHCCCSCNQGSKDHEQKPPTKKTLPPSTTNLNKNRKKALRNFRKYAYAVYFCIYLKYFSMRFTKNRYKFFKDRYLKNDGQKVKEDSYKITKSLEVIDLFSLILQSPDSISKVSNLNLQSSKNLNIMSISKLIPDSGQKQFVKSLNFVNLYLKQLQKIILSQKFIDYYAEIIGIGTLNQSFFMDELMIPQQIQLITFSEKKGFAQINPETQRTLIMTYVFVKHVLFKILLKMKDKKYVETQMKGEYGKFDPEKQQIYEFFDLSNALLYALVNKIFLEHKEQHDTPTNYETLKKRFKICPAKVLTAPTCPEQLKQSVNYNQLIAGVPRVQQVESYLESETYQDYVGYLMDQIENISESLLKKVKKVNKVVYDYVRQETLRQSYIVFDGMKNENNGKQKTMLSIKQTNLNVTNSPNTPLGQNFSRVSNTSLGNMSKMFRKSNL